jgi:polygalacturonase
MMKHRGSLFPPLFNHLSVVGLIVAVMVSVMGSPLARAGGPIDVTAFGAKGDGRTLDSPAINRAIDAVVRAGGGTVHIPAGTYRCGSICLASNLVLELDAGATLEASSDARDYDPPEDLSPTGGPKYQDFGHSHWHNSLLWGENLENVAIVGRGRIVGTGLLNGRNQDNVAQVGGNKAIALKQCRNVLLRDFSIRHGGWFAVLATGTDALTIDNLRIDTNRDGIDIDACRDVRISNCAVNAPDDDAICLKSSLALGVPRLTEHVTISNCHVSGYDEGTMLDGTWKREKPGKPGHLPTGRIKLGTESSGGFRNITLTNCVFDYSLGLALETVDGGILEDVAISNLTMRDIINAPIFLRIGARLRGPAGTTVGRLRRVTLSNIVADNVAPHHGILIAGIPGHVIEDITLSNVLVRYQGGGTAQEAQRVVPEYEKDYPEPGYFGTLPSYGLFARHVKGLVVRNCTLQYATPDLRPPVMLEDASTVVFDDLQADHEPQVQTVVTKNVVNLSIHHGSEVAAARPEPTVEPASPR